MTDTTDLLRDAGADGATAEQQTTAAAAAPRTRRRATSGGLSALVLPELQAMAGELGLSGTARMRKSQLIEAIQQRQAAGSAVNGGSGSGAASTGSGAASTGGGAPSTRKGAAGNGNGAAGTSTDMASNGAPSDSGTPRNTAGAHGAAAAAPTGSSPRETGTADSGTVDAGTADSGTADIGTVETGDADSGAGASDGESRTTSADGRGERPERVDRGRERFLEREARRLERQQNETGDPAVAPVNGQQGAAQQGVAQQGAGGGAQGESPQGRGERPTRDRPQGRPDRPDRTDRQDRTDRPDEGPSRDDEDGGSRRGRFRERGRNRRGRGPERFTPGDAEPVVSDDDVLVPIGGILDIVDNYGFVRTSGYLTGPNDVYVSLQQVRRYGLRRGDAVTGAVRQQREGERKDKYNALVRLDAVNGMDVEEARKRPEFTKLTPLYPQDRLRLETESNVITTRVIDLVMPVGKGQRALIVSPPKAGKTMVMQAIANAIATNNPEVHLMVVLVDERPEEVTDMQRSVKGEVIASTFDRAPQDHITVAELSIERAKRLVELGHDVVVLLDSITRLGRAYNLGAPASGRILTGGVDSAALYPPKRFLGAARNVENGGSLTIFATALVETGSAMDTVIFEEFKGTGNAELKLDRKLADKRIFPAIDVDASSTRKEEILLAPEELRIVLQLRRVLHALDAAASLELLLDKMKSTRNNIEFLMQIQKTSASQEQ